MDYFIDESGNSGDLIHAGDGLDFHDQPVFSLGCVGVKDVAVLQREIERLKDVHRLPGGELKSTMLKSKPAFILDLVRTICTRGHPCFIEVVDKRYFLCAQIVNTQLLPPIAGMAEDAQAAYVRNAMADCLHEHAPEQALALFIAACRKPSEASLRSSLNALASMPISGDSESRDVANAIRECAARTLEECEELRQAQADAHLRFLPIPDDNKRGMPVWMLPNLSSLLNIYARINRYCRRDLAAVRLVHDEQLHFDGILGAGKTAAEALRERAREVYTPHSDFDFVQTAPLVFARSDDSIGLQVADVLAGFVMRYVKDLGARRDVDPNAREAFQILLQKSDPRTAVGVNLVVTTRVAEALRHLHSRFADG